MSRRTLIEKLRQFYCLSQKKNLFFIKLQIKKNIIIFKNKVEEIIELNIVFASDLLEVKLQSSIY